MEGNFIWTRSKPVCNSRQLKLPWPVFWQDEGLWVSHPFGSLKSINSGRKKPLENGIFTRSFLFLVIQFFFIPREQFYSIDRELGKNRKSEILFFIFFLASNIIPQIMCFFFYLVYFFSCLFFQFTRFYFIQNLSCFVL